MPTASSIQVPPPANWQDFESLCSELWRQLWNDPDTQKHGRQGQPQHGVDVYGRPRQRSVWAGVQCKGKDNYTNQVVTAAELKREVKNALQFTPKLSRFILATTGPRDAKIQKLARNLTEQNRQKGLFTVKVMAWPDIVEALDDYPELIEKYCHVPTNTGVLRRELQQGLNALKTEVWVGLAANIVDGERHAEIEQAVRLFRENRPSEAKRYLEALKDRVWGTALPNTRYRIEANLAIVLLDLHQEIAAGKLFVDALAFKQNDPDAMANAAFGYMLLDQTNKAIELADKVIAQRPFQTQAWCVRIDAALISQPLDSIIEGVPATIRQSADVAFSFSRAARLRGQLAESIRWLRVAIQDDQLQRPALLASLGQALFVSVAVEERTRLFGMLLEQEKQQLIEAETLMAQAWAKLPSDEDRKHWAAWLTNLGLCGRMLGKIAEAKNALSQAFSLSPADEYVRRQFALFAMQEHDFSKVCNIYCQVQPATLPENEVCLLAEAKARDGEVQAALGLLTQTMSRCTTPEETADLRCVSLSILLDDGRLTEAKELGITIANENVVRLQELVLLARLARSASCPEEARTFLERALAQVQHEQGRLTDRLMVADECFFARQYQEAARLYEPLQASLRGWQAHKLLTCYLELGQLDRALDVCARINTNNPTPYTVDLQATILEGIGNLPAARNVLTSFLDQADPSAKNYLLLHRAWIDLRLQNHSAVDCFLAEHPETPTDWKQGVMLAKLHALRGQTAQALDVLYELRRRSSQLPEVHAEYILFFFNLQNKKALNLHPVQVDPGVAVQLGSENEPDRWYILEDRSDADPRRHELHVQNGFAQRMLGKREGDKVLRNHEGNPERAYRIVGLKSKYLYALHESMELARDIFADPSKLRIVEVSKPSADGRMPAELRAIFDDHRRHRIQVEQLFRLYALGQMTLGMLARLTGKDLLEMFQYVQGREDLGVYCCLGTREEQDAAKQILTEDVKRQMVADLPTLFKLYQIGLGDALVRNVGKFGVTQSTLDCLLNHIERKRCVEADGYHIMGWEDGELVRQEVTAEQVRQYVGFLEDFWNWVAGNTTVIPATKALELPKSRRDELAEVLGTPALDTILAATTPSYMLLTDDGLLRAMAANDFKVRGVWTQALLQHYVDKQNLPLVDYHKSVIDLACSNYRFLSVNGDILADAAKACEWKPVGAFKLVARYVGKDYASDSGIVVAVDFIHRLWFEQPFPLIRDLCLDEVLQHVFRGRPTLRTMQLFVSRVQSRFSFATLQAEEVIETALRWHRIHIMT